MEPLTTSKEYENASEKTSNKVLSSELTEQRPINDTPFTAVRVNEIWFLTIGKYRLTNQLGSYEECLRESEDSSWNRIMAVMQVMIEHNEEIKKLTKTN